MAIDPTIRTRFLEQLGAHASAYPKQLDEAYPHVLEKIAGLWGTREMEPFFNDLLVTQRSGRKGFSAEAFEEVMGLIGVYHKLGLTVEAPKKNGDVWSWVTDIGYFGQERGN
jgi:hypothetical protein